MQYSVSWVLWFYSLLQGRGVGPMCRRRLTSVAYYTTVPYLIHDIPSDTMDNDDQKNDRWQQSKFYLPPNRLGTYNFFSYWQLLPFIHYYGNVRGHQHPYVTFPQKSTQWLKIGKQYRWNVPDAGSLPVLACPSNFGSSVLLVLGLGYSLIVIFSWQPYK